MQVVCITGGAGFVGLRLAAALLDDPGLSVTLREVRLLDIREPVGLTIPYAPSVARSKQARGMGPHRISLDRTLKEGERLRFVPCDLRSFEQVAQALRGADTVYHLASYGMSGAEMLHVDLIRAVNVGGTENILRACRSEAVTRCIYASTYNTVFATRGFEGGSEEEVAYIPWEEFHDEYSRTKRVAEEMVLKANTGADTEGEGHTTNGHVQTTRKRGSNKKTTTTSSSASNDSATSSVPLHTVVIRPAAIYGDGETRHFPRILRTVRAGFGLVAVGSRDTRCDWVYVDNLVHGLILAGGALASGGAASEAAGQVYAISDGEPINNFDFFRPFCEGLGYKRVFVLFAPFRLMFYLAWLLELLRLLLLCVCPPLAFQPPLTRAEVCKVGVTHWFSMGKARRELGYRPIVQREEATRRCVEFYMDEFGTGEQKRRSIRQQQMQMRVAQRKDA